MKADHTVSHLKEETELPFQVTPVLVTGLKDSENTFRSHRGRGRAQVK